MRRLLATLDPFLQTAAGERVFILMFRALGRGRRPPAQGSPDPSTMSGHAAPGSEAERLKALEHTGLLSSPMLPELEEICQRAKSRFEVAIAMVTLVTRDQVLAKARVGTDFEAAPRDGQFCDQTIRNDDVFVVPDATQDTRFAANPVVTSEPFIRFYAGAPLIYLRGIRLGSLCLLDPHARELSVSDKAELTLLASEVAQALVAQDIDNRTGALGRRKRSG